MGFTGVAVRGVTEIDDALLVSRAQGGDSHAFSQLVNRHQRKIYRLAQNITGHREDSEDVLQETFLKAYEHLAGFHGDSKFYTWLVRIATNQSLMKLRRSRTDRSVSFDETFDAGDETVTREIAVWGGDPEHLYSREELRAILVSAIQELPPLFRAVFALRDIEELATEETAEILNLSVPAVKSRLLRARLHLRRKLAPHFRRRGTNELSYTVWDSHSWLSA